MVPEGWQRARLAALVSSVNAGVSVNGEDRPAGSREFGVLKISAVTTGAFDPGQNKLIRDLELTRAATRPKADRVMVSRCNTESLVGASAYIERDHENLFLPDKLWQLEPRTSEHPYMRWLSYWLACPATRTHLSKLATGTSGSMKNITKEQLLSLEVLVPPLTEQRRIARILSTWDQAIATAERLVAASQTEKDVLANALLSGRRRLIQHQRWEPRPLSAMVSESRVLGSGGDKAKKLTVKLYGRGVVGKSEKRVGSESTQYYRRSPGQFIYSKLDFLNGAFGLVPANLDGYESTLDLPAFDFLPGTEPRWFLHFVSRQEFYLGHLGLANGGRKARRVNPSDLLRVSIDTPSFAEQRAIAEAVDLAQTRVICFERQVLLLRDEKAALMAQLLTGKRRVNLNQEGVPAP